MQTSKLSWVHAHPAVNGETVYIGRFQYKTHVLTPKLDRDSMHVWLGARIPCC